MSREMLKTITLFLLCLLAGYMLKGLWLDDIISTDRSAKLNAMQTRDNVAYLLTPKAVNISFGGGEMTTFFFDKGQLFEPFKPSLQEALIKIEEAKAIDADVYFRMRLQKSIEYVLPSAFETQQLLALLSNEIHPVSKSLEKIQKILVVSREQKRIFVQGESQYYEVLLNSDIEDITGVIDGIDLKDLVPYESVDRRFTLNTVLSQNTYVPNEVLVPKFSLNAVTPARVRAEFSPTLVDDVRAMARNVFGSKLNFVQESVDINHGLVLLYGYGDRAMHVSVNGNLEYSERMRSQNKYERHFLNNLNTALNMIERLGGEPESLFLSSVIPIEQGDSKGFKYNFEYRIKDYRVVDLNSPSGISVDVFGDLVSNYKRNVLVNQGNMVLDSTLALKHERDDEQFFNMLNDEDTYAVIKGHYIEDNGITPEGDSPQLIYQILSDITSMEVVMIPLSDARLSPAVALAIDGRIYYIDFYSYELIFVH